MADPVLGKYGDNESSPSPFYILKENAQGKSKKSSGEKYHIDLFYGFIVPDSIIFSDSNKCWKSIDDIRKCSDKEVYKDLIPVGQALVNQRKEISYPESKIRFCTFSARNSGRKIYWRLTKACNAKCSYCVSQCNQCKDDSGIKTSEMTYDKIDGIIEKIKYNQYEKVIITGGEPTLCKNELLYIVKKLQDDAPSCYEVSLCTNGINWSNDLYEELCKSSKLSKYVVSIDSYDEEKYAERKGKNEANHNYLKGLVLCNI